LLHLKVRNDADLLFFRHCERSEAISSRVGKIRRACSYYCLYIKHRLIYVKP
jgi:hypothetical protein